MPICDLCGGTALTGNVCAMCGLRAPVERLTVANSVNLQVCTVEELIERFVVENHQAKHYAGGNRDYAHFDSTGGNLDWREVHQVIVFSVKQILTLQKERGLIKPCDGYVRFGGMKKAQEWYAGRNKGYSNVVLVQLTLSIKDGFSGHGYPLDSKRVNALGRDAYLADANYGDWASVKLNSANSSIRIMHIGA